MSVDARAARALAFEAALEADRGALQDALTDLPCYRDAPELLLFDAIEAVLARDAGVRVDFVQGILCAALEGLEGPGPRASLDDMRADAGLWAAAASPRELEVYMGAIAQALGARGLPPALRKRLIVALWEGLDAEARRAFLERVDPRGRFHNKDRSGRAAS